MYTFMAVLFVVTAGLLVKTFAPYACGSGIPEIKTILSGFIIKGYLGKWTLLIKSLGMVLAVATGLSLGKEGPLVHICCCIGNVVSYLFPKYGKNEAKKREILSAAAAAGVSTAFGAPIGGVLFSLEEVSYYFPLKTMWRSFFCALVAAFVLRSINPFGTEHAVMFYVDYDRTWILIELIPFLILGVFGGLVGSVFIKANTMWCNVRKTGKLGKYPITEVIVITLITSVFAYPNEFTRMNSSELIRLLFSQCGIADNSILCDYKTNYTNVINAKTFSIAEAGAGVYKSINLLIVALIFKFVITVFTFGIKVPTGLFIPSLTMGAIAGRCTGILMEQIAFKYPNSWVFQGSCSTGVNCMTPGIYAVVGAAACLSGITRMTVSLVVIVFEITGSVNFIVPLMCAVMTAKWVGDALGKQGIYDAHILLNGYPYLDSKEEFTYKTTAEDCMQSLDEGSQSFAYLTQHSMTTRNLEFLIKKNDFNGYPIVVSDDSRYLVGFVLRKDLENAIFKAKSVKADLDPNTKVIFSVFTNKIDTSLRENYENDVLGLHKIVDFAPITVAVATPMETVIDMFRKLGLRQVIVTQNG
ncbi:hypothetical protein RND71_044220 [Anisodus tanguticus]|uniref:Chloride channel protein n=1 Tax=Anisodus tanguticus TaxID=243964 RepID=A0AAE1UN02_9SOLA|nr:hypothetical protein RND71_044220 [Anisodus tanguticus]